MAHVGEELSKKVLKIYNDKKNWIPPSGQFIADKLGITRAAVHYVLTANKKKK